MNVSTLKLRGAINGGRQLCVLNFNMYVNVRILKLREAMNVNGVSHSLIHGLGVVACVRLPAFRPSIYLLLSLLLCVCSECLDNGGLCHN